MIRKIRNAKEKIRIIRIFLIPYLKACELQSKEIRDLIIEFLLHYKMES